MLDGGGKGLSKLTFIKLLIRFLNADLDTLPEVLEQIPCPKAQKDISSTIYASFLFYFNTCQNYETNYGAMSALRQ